MNNTFPTTRALASVLIMSTAALVACQLPPPKQQTAPVAQVSTPAPSMPAPQPPFDTTPITPVESAGAATE